MSATALSLEVRAESFRGELVRFCYRFFGSYAEAEDAVQETMVRAWQHAEKFEGRASLRTWLYKIATNICLDMKRAPQRRSLPMDLSAPGTVPGDPSSLATRPEPTWVGPIPDSAVVASVDPADVAVMRESVRLAFITALQVLPPRQRVVLILRDVLNWSAQESAELLDGSAASMNSALARARKTMIERGQTARPVSVQESAERLLAEYVAAFAAYDVDRLVRLLAEDATFSMPPFELWLRGTAQIDKWWRGPGQICRNSRLIPTRANGQPAVAVYHDVGGRRWEPFAVHVLDVDSEQIAGIVHFMGSGVFLQFSLPTEVLEPADPTS